LLADADFAVLLVDVAPAQSEHFTAAQPIEQQQHERGIQRVVLGDFREGAGLGRGPWRNGLAFPHRQLGQARDIANNQFLTHRPRQRRGQNSPHHLDNADRAARRELLVEEGLDAGCREPGKWAAAQPRLQIEPDRHLIQPVRRRPAIQAHDVL
jgi:hypothetical protein